VQARLALGSLTLALALSGGGWWLWHPDRATGSLAAEGEAEGEPSDRRAADTLAAQDRGVSGRRAPPA
jgi:hypothetical protein